MSEKRCEACVFWKDWHSGHHASRQGECTYDQPMPEWAWCDLTAQRRLMRASEGTTCEVFQEEP